MQQKIMYISQALETPSFMLHLYRRILLHTVLTELQIAGEER